MAINNNELLCLLVFTSLLCFPHLYAAKLWNDQNRYEPNWDSLDKRVAPVWYDQAKFGIFIHWGVFSVPSFKSEWFWDYWKGDKPHKDVIKFMEQNYPPDYTYADFASQFTAEFFNPAQWADIFEAAGAKYVVLVTKHHEGYTNWPSKASFNWNSMDVGPHRDLTGELAAAIRNKTGMHFGVYHSMFEWFNPLFLEDKANKFKTQNFVTQKTMVELYELVNKYKPEVIWSDGDWCCKDTYWNSTQFLAWLYNDSPVKDTVLVNDRWGSGTSCKHGDFYNCKDRFDPGVLQDHKWENAMTIDRHSWGYRRESTMSDMLSTYQIISELVITVSCGGNLLLNVGPRKDGRIPEIFEERLRQIGSWLGVNGEAVYGSRPWTYQNDTVNGNVWYTMNSNISERGNDNTLYFGSDTGKTIYAFLLTWPEAAVLTLGAPTGTSKTIVTMLGVEGKEFQWESSGGVNGGMQIQFPALPINKLPSTIVWVLKITDIQN